MQKRVNRIIESRAETWKLLGIIWPLEYYRMNQTPFEHYRDILMMKLSGHHMDTEDLLRITPKEIAESLLIRRTVLKDQLPNIIKNLDNESESLTPKMAKILEKNNKINFKISEIKNKRDLCQKEAGEIWNEIKEKTVLLN